MPEVTVPVRYIGHKPVKYDNVNDPPSGLAWMQGQVIDVPLRYAIKLVRHPDVWEEARAEGERKLLIVPNQVRRELRDAAPPVLPVRLQSGDPAGDGAKDGEGAEPEKFEGRGIEGVDGEGVGQAKASVPLDMNNPDVQIALAEEAARESEKRRLEDGDLVEDTEPATPPPALSHMSKESLITYAQSKHGVVLDRRWSEDRMRSHIVTLEAKRHAEPASA